VLDGVTAGVDAASDATVPSVEGTATGGRVWVGAGVEVACLGRALVDAFGAAACPTVAPGRCVARGLDACAGGAEVCGCLLGAGVGSWPAQIEA
jgi:hypothetical protein